MAFNRPTLDQLIERVKTDIKGEMQITTILRRSFLSAISRALAGLSHLHFGFLDWLSDQVFPDTAESEYIDRWAVIWGVIRKEATFAQMTITITGNSGGVVPAGTTYQRTDGVEYTLDSEVTIPVSGTIEGTITCSNAGESGNIDIGNTVSLISPIANVDTEATISTVVIDAEDQESDDSLRSRLLSRISSPPLGGSANDYITWALEVAGVTRAWVLPLYLGAGTVGVSFVEDGEVDIIPSAAKVDEVNSYILERKPVTADLTTFAPVEAAMDLTIKLKPNTTDVQDAVMAELEDLIKRDATLAGSYKSPSENNTGTILLSKINQAIGIAVGVEDHEISLINGLAPANVTPNVGELITLGNITWQPLA